MCVCVCVFLISFFVDAGFSTASLPFEGCVDTERLLPQAPADLQRRRQPPIPQRVTTVTCLVLFLNLQTAAQRNRGRERARGERGAAAAAAAKGPVKERRTFAQPASLIDGCREWEEIRKPPDRALALWKWHIQMSIHRNVCTWHRFLRLSRSKSPSSSF